MLHFGLYIMETFERSREKGGEEVQDTLILIMIFLLRKHCDLVELV